jgi:chromosome segregation ATPase
MKHIARGSAALVAAALALAACDTTYQREKADLTMGGGQSYRLQQAQQGLDEAKAKNVSLREEQEMARAELADLQTQLKTVQKQRAERIAALNRAKAKNRITAEKQAALTRRVDTASDDFLSTALELESAQARGASAEVKRKQEELEKLRAELRNLDKEISVLQ